MSKDPAILFYTSDFLSGTMTMSDEQVGKYIRLLCLQHQKGHLTEKDMLYICKSHDEDIFCKFIKDAQDKWFNTRLESEIVKRINYSESRRNNRKSKEPKEDILNTSNTYDEHMENENENENINDNGNEIKKETEEQKALRLISEKKEKERLYKIKVNDFFETIWKLYPKKEGKGSVSETQKGVLFKLGFDVIKRCVDRYIEAKQGTDTQFLQMGSTFFNSGYIDYLDENYSNDSKSKKEETSNKMVNGSLKLNW